MKIKKAEVDWMDKWANDPVLVVYVDTCHDAEMVDVIHDVVQIGFRGERLFRARRAGAVRYFLEDPSNREGFGGSTWRARVSADHVEEIRGPWSSRAGVVNAVFGEPHCVDVTIIADDVGGGKSRLALAVDLDVAREALQIAAPGVGFYVDRSHGETTYRIRKSDKPMSQKDH